MLGAHVACLVVWYFHDNPRQCVLDVLQPVDVLDDVPSSTALAVLFSTGYYLNVLED